VFLEAKFRGRFHEKKKISTTRFGMEFGFKEFGYEEVDQDSDHRDRFFRKIRPVEQQRLKRTLA